MTWVLVLAALLLAWASPVAADLSGVGSEVPVGANGTGEACRLRVITDEPARGAQRLNFYCDGWSVSSATPRPPATAATTTTGQPPSSRLHCRIAAVVPSPSVVASTGPHPPSLVS